MNIKVFGFILIAFSLFLGIGDAYSMWRFGQSLSLGDVWSNINRSSLNLFQVAIERHVWPPLWLYFFYPILLTPAWLASLIAGGVCLLIGVQWSQEDPSNVKETPRKRRD
jgi:hypothetical protein